MLSMMSLSEVVAFLGSRYPHFLHTHAIYRGSKLTTLQEGDSYYDCQMLDLGPLDSTFVG